MKVNSFSLLPLSAAPHSPQEAQLALRDAAAGKDTPALALPLIAAILVIIALLILPTFKRISIRNRITGCV